MEFRIQYTIEVDQRANALAIATPIPIQLCYDRGKWVGQCENPPVITAPARTMQDALTDCAKQVTQQVQSSVIDRPVVAARITPDGVLSMFQ